ncbi:hypothetical protein L1887_17876 [Cichorium endivia]|nr:hypothetical protein L1887_17876 [Cichorium endivia]
MNPTDLFSIVLKLSTKEKQAASEAYVAAKQFLHGFLEELCSADAEMFKVVKDHLDQQIPEKVDLPMPDNRDNWKRGVTYDPVLGLSSDLSISETSEFQNFTFRNLSLSVSYLEYLATTEGLKHNLVSISQMVVRTGNAVTFNNQGSVISKEATKKVLLKSERKGSMFPLNLKPVTGGQSLCLLSKANSDVS